jgi:hypothetical protein
MTRGRTTSVQVVAWTAAAFAALCVAATSILDLTLAANPFSHAGELDGFPVTVLGALLATVLGAVILSRFPGHLVGWLLCAGEAGTAAGLAADAFALRFGSTPAVVVATLFGGAYAVAVTSAVFLLVPDGRLPSRRWRAVPALLVLAYLLSLLPFPWARYAGVFAMAAGAIAAVAALVVRLRRSRGERRRQLRWVMASGVLLAGGLLLFAAGVTPFGLYLGFAAVPVCAGIAILKYHLYGIDVIINRAVVLAVLAAFVTVGYVSLVIGVSAALGTGVDRRFWPSLGVLVVVALAFQPLRQRVLRLADRVVYGQRAAPYEALADFTARLGRTRAPGELLPAMAESVARGTGAAVARVSLELPRLSAAWPRLAERAPDVELEVRDGSDVLGHIGLVMPAGRGLLPVERRLLDDFASQAALALRTLRLDAELRDQAEQMSRQAAALEASRRRLLAARDAERRRTAGVIEREVVSHLRPIPDAVGQLDVADVPGALSLLRRADQAVEAALEALREVTHGVFPAVLAHRGLAAALRGHASRTGRWQVLTIDPRLAGLRFPEPIETTAYLCAAALLTEADVLTVSAEEHALVIEASGRPDAGDDLLDRVEAVGGRMSRRAQADGPASVRVELPAQPPLPAQPASPASPQTASSRSTPKEDLVT